MRVVAILLAAGAATRFQADKLHADYRGRPLYRHALDALTAAPAVAATLVVVGPSFPIPPAVERCTFLVNPEPAEGMGSSLRVGVRAAPEDAGAYLIALADMPALRPELIGDLIAFHAAAGRPITVPVHRGRRGHPVLVSRELREELLRVQGDVGARDILRAHAAGVAEFETEDPAVLFDVDTPGDLPGAR
ncbi:MAG TPA: nucleotidyltransferase family protein [Candidatus Saccharimonadales bacterium]|nr:nucleotidyltransferase family protein [Candidatus Saccharimonadales bacterium]